MFARAAVGLPAPPLSVWHQEAQDRMSYLEHQKLRLPAAGYIYPVQWAAGHMDSAKVVPGRIADPSAKLTCAPGSWTQDPWVRKATMCSWI